ncbi:MULTISPECIES: SAM-dependent methyltransferase [Streptomyces]|uniref:SAM-dependent methyltransferase n=1 Tax=Streptomyces bangladeshensis TaxID=295352 RepID=A0ABN3BSR1_9ACTN|nr:MULTISPECIES: SAM-dependent methyltransferase [unclassified Streptomyces]AKN74218.1 methyltransferase [Streptomyces sp. PBH53]MYU31495.1 SAM-dependent methyltransferase [Streptomyces sp. SID7810]OYP13986.1 SAM-dependent methyltransferase [Streptomyces sp. FBKL.4005]CUW32608.1 S-adenosyl methyltransferase [Streptomyces reticuli]
MTGTGPEIQDTIDTTRPHPARVYDWFLGGKDNYPVDEELGRRIAAMDGDAPKAARANRAFMRRTTRALAAESGIRQFLDIGTGIPTEPNLHQIAQSVAPDARVVYVDNDPIVLAHAEALLRGTPEGVTEYVQADARDPHTILERAARVLDLDRPVALSLIALLHFIADEDGAHDLVDTLVGALAPGSFLVLSAMTADFEPENVRKGIAAYAAGGVTLVARSHAEVGAFFTGLRLLEPGIVPVAEWRPEDAPDGPVSLYGGVAVKP